MANASKCAALFHIFIYKTGEILKFSRFFSRPILVARFWPILCLKKKSSPFPCFRVFFLKMCLFSLFCALFM